VCAVVGEGYQVVVGANSTRGAEVRTYFKQKPPPPVRERERERERMIIASKLCRCTIPRTLGIGFGDRDHGTPGTDESSSLLFQVF
jgi:hypothetical protein